MRRNTTRTTRPGPARVWIEQSWHGEVLEVQPLERGASFRHDGRQIVHSDRNGRVWLRLDEGALEVEVGDAASIQLGALTVTVIHDASALPVIERPRFDRRLALCCGGAMFAAVGALVASALLPASADTLAEREMDRLELARRYVVRAEMKEIEADQLADTDHEEGGTGMRAKGEQGTMGRAGRRTGNRYGLAGPSGDPQIARRSAQREAAEFGMIGLLNSGATDDGSQPNLWGADARAPLGPARVGHGGPPATTAGKDANNGESYADYGVNPPTRPSDDPVSTFALDVDTASYAIARRKLKRGELPAPRAVRAEEFLNYFDYGYPSPRNAPIAAQVDAAPSPFHREHHLVRVGVQAKRVSRAERKPVHLVYLVDTSGSMQSPDKMGLVKESLRMLTRSLKPSDTVALCTYAGSVREVLPPTRAQQRGHILKAIDALTAGGSTAMSSGIELAYDLAQRSLVRSHVNRVVVLSDGDANVGNTSHTDILDTIRKYTDQGITLSTVGFGTGNYKDTMMERLADEGDGNYSYVDTPTQAHRIFVQQVDGLLQVVARDVKVQVEFDPRYVESYRLLGYENRDVADKDFRNDAVDGGEVGAGHNVTAIYDVALKRTHLAATFVDGRSWVTVRVRHKPPGEDAPALEHVYGLDPSDVLRSFDQASDSFRLAASVAGFAEVMRHSPYASNWNLQRVAAIARSTPATADRDELLQLVGNAQRLM